MLQELGKAPGAASVLDTLHVCEDSCLALAPASTNPPTRGNAGEAVRGPFPPSFTWEQDPWGCASRGELLPAGAEPGVLSQGRQWLEPPRQGSGARTR